MNFSDFSFDPRLMGGLESMGYERPTPVQQLAIPEILQNHDLVACAQTGTGKTAAYLLPTLHKILQTENRHLNTLVIAPTRELVQQIDQQVEGFGYFTGISSIPVYGGGDGQAWDAQRKAMESGVEIVIATPGRLIALLQAGTIKFDHLQHLILDEADRMLDMGFYEDILRIISYLPTERQTILFSATMPPRIRTLASKILKDPREVSVAIAKPAAGIDQQAYVVFDEQKPELLKHLLKTLDWTSMIIFCSTKEMVKKLDQWFRRLDYEAKAFHSDLDQAEREDIMRAFRNKQVSILIGTDVLSRGIDVEGISVVINYDVPPDPEDYVHRVGRTARAETTGTAVTLINPRDQRRFSYIEKLIEREIPKLPLPEFLGAAPEYSPMTKRPAPAGNRPKGGGQGGKRRHPHHKPSGRRNHPGGNK